MKTWYPFDEWIRSAFSIFPFFAIAVIVALKVLPTIMGTDSHEDKEGFQFKTIYVFGRSSAFLVAVITLTVGWLLCWPGLKQDFAVWQAAASGGTYYGDGTIRSSPTTLVFRDLLILFCGIPFISWFLWAITMWAFHFIDSILRRVFRSQRNSPATVPTIR